MQQKTKQQQQSIFSQQEISVLQRHQNSKHQNSQQQQQHFIGELQKAPEFMGFNQQIREGYRIGYSNPVKILKSLFMMHNETLNIWTHLIGAIIVFGMILWCFMVVDKAQLDYQLKSYQKDLSNSYEKLDMTLEKIYKTTHAKYLGQADHALKRQIEDESDQITLFFKKSLKGIKNILHKNVSLSQEQLKIRERILAKTSSLERLGTQLQAGQKEFIIFLGVSPYRLPKILKKLDNLEEQMKATKNQLTSLVIQYLELEKETPNPYGVPRWPILVFLFTATLCMTCSAIFHLFMSMSETAFKYFRRLDYAGVIINVIGTGVAPIYYTLYCDFDLGKIYISAMVILGTVVFFTLMSDWIQSQPNRKYKPFLFITFGFTYLVPYTHFMLSDRFSQNLQDSFRFSNGNIWWVMSTGSYLLGIAFLVNRFPETQYPKRFDIIGSSHQIWHVLCLLGVTFTYIAINIHYEDRKICPCKIQ